MKYIVKRYPNRKLYDTKEKKYIGLEDIDELICRGFEIKVIDNANGDDLTALTLSHVLLHNLKRTNGFLPNTILTNLIQSGNKAGSSVCAGKSELSLLQGIYEIEESLGLLVESGDLSTVKAGELLIKIRQLIPRNDISTLSNAAVLSELLTDYGFASITDLQSVTKQLDILSKKIDLVIMNNNDLEVTTTYQS